MQALTGKHASPAAAAEHLEKLFSEGGKSDSKRVTVLLVDEMDLLITKKQQVKSVAHRPIITSEGRPPTELGRSLLFNQAQSSVLGAVQVLDNLCEWLACKGSPGGYQHRQYAGLPDCLMPSY